MTRPISLCTRATLFCLLISFAIVAQEKKFNPKIPTTETKTADIPDLTRQQQAEKILLDAKLSIKSDDLIQYIQKRTISIERRIELAKLTDQLGSDSFEDRQFASDVLIEAGLPAVPYLRKAGRAEDPEVVYRANGCMKKIDQSKESEVFMASIRLLAFQKSPQTVKVILDYLPCSVEEADIQETIFESLVEYSKLIKSADPTLHQSLNDSDPKIRILAIRVLGTTIPSERPEIQKCLSDVDPDVRFWAGMTLVKSGDKSPFPKLLDSLTDASVDHAYELENLLCQIGGPELELITTIDATPASRKTAKEFWQAWWKKNEAKVDLAKLKEEEAIRGITIIAEFDGQGPGGGKGGGQSGRIWACRKDGSVLWEWTGINGPIDIQRLPNGHLLVAEFYGRVVTERDLKGKIVWKTPPLVGQATTVNRLPNGNTLVSSFQNVYEFNREGKQVGNPLPIPNNIFRIRRVKNGHIFVQTSQEIIQLDANRKELHRIKNPKSALWRGFDILPNGNFLASYYGSDKNLIELNREGKIIREYDTPTNCPHVQRLRNGNALLASSGGSCVIEYNSEKKEIWRVSTKGEPYGIIRY